MKSATTQESEMTTAQRTHQFMVESRQAAEDRRLIECADNVLRSGKFSADILNAIRRERDERATRFEAFVARHGARAVAF